MAYVGPHDRRGGPQPASKRARESIVCEEEPVSRPPQGEPPVICPRKIRRHSQVLSDEKERMFVLQNYEVANSVLRMLTLERMCRMQSFTGKVTAPSAHIAWSKDHSGFFLPVGSRPSHSPLSGGSSAPDEQSPTAAAAGIARTEDSGT